MVWLQEVLQCLRIRACSQRIKVGQRLLAYQYPRKQGTGNPVIRDDGTQRAITLVSSPEPASQCNARAYLVYAC